ncbi:MAG: hypothetical protein EPN70_18845 [Paraburkholderia sp.]|uniref:hypothetical protein n=1 Tax=Paraburkholderia sp. TaxID=1926495 RepID=UPI00121A1338|nr:hypothetical protein [Paraburkholderia sp.]TAM01714.1 MAG: hypothetical protein EPN70_18845 [Paraburkholderia sp.]
MSVNGSTLDLETIRADVFRLTGQKIDLNDPLFAVLLFVDHAVSRNLIAAQDAAAAIREMLDRSGGGLGENLGLLAKRVESAGDGVEMLLTAFKSYKDSVSKSDASKLKALEEINVELRQHAATLRQSASEAAMKVDTAVSGLSEKYIALHTGLGRVAEVMGHQPQQIAAEIRASEWRTALKVGAVVVVIEVGRFALSHWLHIG